MHNLADWSDLPVDLLPLILGRLPIKDYVRSTAVCSSWYFAAKLVSFAPSFPWLTVDPIGNGFSTTRVMFDPLSGKEQCNVELQSCISVIGSTSCGCLVYLTGNNRKLVVVNPLTGSRLILPSTISLEYHRIKTIALLGGPPAVVAITCFSDRREYVAFSRPGDKSWTFLCNASCILSLIFQKGLLYQLTRYRGTTVWDFRGEHSPRRMSTLNNSDTGFNFYVKHIFLVESSAGDNLLQVHSTMYGQHAIFKLEEDPAAATGRWCRVASLCGDDALVLSPNRAVCLSTVVSSDLQGNCIYSILPQSSSSDTSGLKRKSSVKERFMHVFNLGDGTMQSVPLHIHEDLELDWFNPSLL